MFQSYDPQNIFAKILRSEIPSKPILDNDHVLAFHDISPQAKIHILVIPKGAYISFQEFTEKATDQEQLVFYKSIAKLAKKFDMDEKGYRLISNCKMHGGQEIPHFHMHILGGEQLGGMV